MDFIRGQIVRSKAGHDAGMFYVVMGIDKQSVYLCNGKSHSLMNPKKKNKIHIAGTKTVLPESSLQTDSEIRKAIKHISE